MDKTYEALKDHLGSGLIERAKSEWKRQVVFVPKRNGKMRSCVEYFSLKKVTVGDKLSRAPLQSTLPFLPRSSLLPSYVIQKLCIIKFIHIPMVHSWPSSPDLLMMQIVRAPSPGG